MARTQKRPAPKAALKQVSPAEEKLIAPPLAESSSAERQFCGPWSTCARAKRPAPRGASDTTRSDLLAQLARAEATARELSKHLSPILENPDWQEWIPMWQWGALDHARLQVGSIILQLRGHQTFLMTGVAHG